MSEETSYRIYSTDYIVGIGNPLLFVTVKYQCLHKHMYRSKIFLLVPSYDCYFDEQEINFFFTDEDIQELDKQGSTKIDLEFIHKTLFSNAKNMLDKFFINLQSNNNFMRLNVSDKFDAKNIIWSCYYQDICKYQLNYIKENCRSSELKELLEFYDFMYSQKADI